MNEIMLHLTRKDEAKSAPQKEARRFGLSPRGADLDRTDNSRKNKTDSLDESQDDLSFFLTHVHLLKDDDDQLQCKGHPCFIILYLGQISISTILLILLA